MSINPALPLRLATACCKTLYDNSNIVTRLLIKRLFNSAQITKEYIIKATVALWVRYNCRYNCITFYVWLYNISNGIVLFQVKVIYIVRFIIPCKKLWRSNKKYDIFRAPRILFKIPCFLFSSRLSQFLPVLNSFTGNFQPNSVTISFIFSVLFFRSTIHWILAYLPLSRTIFSVFLLLDL